MESIFIELLNRSITASFLIVLVIILHFVLRGIPRNVNCILWLLVAIRLIFPVSIESAFSVLPAGEPVRQIMDNVLEVTAPAIDVGNVEAVPANTTVNQNRQMEVQAEDRNILPTVGAAVWLSGFVVMAAYTMLSLFKLQKRVRERIPYREQIFLCDNIDTPFILGIFRPQIYLPSNIEEHQIPYVLQHEKAHLKRLDHLWKVLGYMVLLLHWFNPLAWISYKLFCKDIELACDEKVIRNIDNTEKKKYSTALLECSVKKSAIALSPLAFGELSVKKRIKAILDYKKPAFWTILAAIVICIIIAISFLTNPVTEKEYSDEELVELAAEYYMVNSGRDYLYLPEYIEISAAAEEEQVLLSLFDIVEEGEEGGHGVTWAAYQVNRKTAVGFETRSFEDIDLTKAETSHDFTYYIVEEQEGRWQLDTENITGIETYTEAENNENNEIGTDSEADKDDEAAMDQVQNDILERFSEIDWDELEDRDLQFTGSLDNPTQIQCIGEIPEYQIKLYGYGDDDFQGAGVAIQIGEDVNFFDWFYTSSRAIPPSVYWNDKDKILQTALRIYTGTGAAAEELHVLRQYQTGTLDDAVFTLDDYSLLLQEMTGFQYIENEKKLQLINLSDNSILTEVENIEAPEGIEALELGWISTFILGDNIFLQVEPGYCPTGHVIAEYEGMPTLIYPVLFEADERENISFRLGEPHVAEEDEIVY